LHVLFSKTYQPTCVVLYMLHGAGQLLADHWDWAFCQVNGITAGYSSQPSAGWVLHAWQCWEFQVLVLEGRRVQLVW
jgi:hypothetical protein